MVYREGKCRFEEFCQHDKRIRGPVEEDKELDRCPSEDGSGESPLKGQCRGTSQSVRVGENGPDRHRAFRQRGRVRELRGGPEVLVGPREDGVTRDPSEEECKKEGVHPGEVPSPERGGLLCQE